MWEWLRRLFGGRQRSGDMKPQTPVKLPEILVTWYNTPTWPESRRWLEDHRSEIPENGPELLDTAAEQARTAGGSEDTARVLAVHAKLLREARRIGVDDAYLAIIGDDREPSPERQQELRTKHEENVKVGKPPYAGVVIQTKGELTWIVKVREWKRDDFETREQIIDLRQIGVSNAVLFNFDLSFANLSGAEINKSDFSDAILTHTNLSDTGIHDTDFSGVRGNLANLSNVWMTRCSFTDANLTLSNLSGAIILSCTFTRTKLTFANLTGAGISGEDSDFFSDVSLAAANLSGAELLIGFKDSDGGGSDLRQARMDSTTMLGDSGKHGNDRFQFTNERASLLDVSWSGAILANVWWKPLERLGDEAAIKEATSRKERVDALQDAARAYRGLAKALQAQGLTDDALRYRTRERQLERRALLSRWSVTKPWLIFAWLGSGLLNIVSGYGDMPARAGLCYLIVIGAFMDAYLIVTHQLFGINSSKSASLNLLEALVLSISSFHGRGFFPSSLALHDPVAVVAAAEAIIGLFIELVFIATFTQRFFSR